MKFDGLQQLSILPITVGGSVLFGLLVLGCLQGILADFESKPHALDMPAPLAAHQLSCDPYVYCLREGSPVDHLHVLMFLSNGEVLKTGWSRGGDSVEEQLCKMAKWMKERRRHNPQSNPMGLAQVRYSIKNGQVSFTCRSGEGGKTVARGNISQHALILNEFSPATHWSEVGRRYVAVRIVD